MGGGVTILLATHDQYIAFLDYSDKDQTNPATHLALHMGNKDIVTLLLDHGARAATKDRTNDQPLIHQALMKNKEDHQIFDNLFLTTIINKLSPIDVTDQQGRTPLFHSFHNPQILQLLLEKGASIEHRTPSGLAPLHSATAQGYPESVKILLDRGANINAVTSDKSDGGQTALCIAVNNQIDDPNKQFETIIDTLINKKANATLADLKHKNTPLHIAAQKAFDVQTGIPVLEKLITYAPSTISSRNRRHQTPLGCLIEELAQRDNPLSLKQQQLSKDQLQKLNTVTPKLLANNPTLLAQTISILHEFNQPENIFDYVDEKKAKEPYTELYTGVTHEQRERADLKR